MTGNEPVLSGARMAGVVEGLEEAALDAALKARVEAALADPAPSLAQEDVFAELRARHATRTQG